LLFVCAHPAIDPTMHTPLMLQSVLGLDAARIGQAFLIAQKTMGQRLFRAKTKIRSGGIPFEIPQEPDLPERLDAVLEGIYAAFEYSVKALRKIRRSEEHTSELQSRGHLVCRLLLEKKKPISQSDRLLSAPRQEGGRRGCVAGRALRARSDRRSARN